MRPSNERSVAAGTSTKENYRCHFVGGSCGLEEC